MRFAVACFGILPTFVSDERDNHGVEVEEEHQQVETQLDERFFLVHVQFAEDLCCVEKMLVFEDSVSAVSLCHSFVPLRICAPICKLHYKASLCHGIAYFFPFHAIKGRFKINGNQYPLMRNKMVRNA